MKKLILIILIVLPFLQSRADTIDLKYCYNLVYQTYPSLKQKPINTNINSLKITNYGINWYPQISFNGKISYQSDVPELTISNPLFSPPKLNKDWYSMTLNINQQIYDGGTTSLQTEIEKSQIFVDNQKIDVDIFSLKQKINDLYFAVLILQEKKKVLMISKEDLENRIREMESKIKNGAIPANSTYVLQAQILQIESDITATNIDILSSIKMLSTLLNTEINNETELSIPDINYIDFSLNQIKRPEYQLFEYQKNQFNAYGNLINSRILPRVGVFGQFGFGRPGLNYLDNSFKGFYVVGLNLQWNPFNWGKDNNDRQIWEANKSIVDNQKETFDRNLQVTLEKYKNDITKFEELLKKDDEIISLRKKIVTNYASQLENGIITSTTYVTELNNLTSVNIQMQTHKIQLIQSKINYLTAIGNF